MNISSIVVRTRPEHLETVKSALTTVETCDIHFTDDKGHLVVTVEGTEGSDETVKLKQILALPHVLSADFSFMYSEEE